MSFLQSILLYILPLSPLVPWFFNTQYIIQYFSNGGHPLYLFNRFFELIFENAFLRLFSLPHLAFVISLPIMLAKEAVPRGYSLWKMLILGYFIAFCGLLPLLLGLSLTNHGKKYSEKIFPMKSIIIFILINLVYLIHFPGESTTKPISQIAFVLYFFGSFCFLMVFLRNSNFAYKEIDGLYHSNVGYAIAAAACLAINVYAWSDFLKHTNFEDILKLATNNLISISIIIDQGFCILACIVFLLADGERGLGFAYRLLFAILAVPLSSSIIPFYLIARSGNKTKID